MKVTAEITAAAERKRRHAAAEIHSDEWLRYVRQDCGVSQCDRDNATLAQAYLDLTTCPTRTAISVLGDAAERLPEGWLIELEFSRDEASMSLVDPDTGSDVDEYFGDFECSFLGAIETAVEQSPKGGAE